MFFSLYTFDHFGFPDKGGTFQLNVLSLVDLFIIFVRY